MDVGIIRDFMGQKIPPVKPLIMKWVKPHPIRGAAQSGQQGGEPGKQFQIDNGVDPVFSGPKQEPQRIDGQGKKAIFPDTENIFRRYGFQKIKTWFILFENDEMKLPSRAFLEFFHGRVGQYGATHLGELNQKDILRLLPDRPSHQIH